MKRFIIAIVLFAVVAVFSIFGPASPANAVSCIGDGKSGKRVQMIYAYSADIADNSAVSLPEIKTIADIMDQQVLASAQKTGGDRRIRFVTNPDCTVNIIKVVIPTSVWTSATGFNLYYNLVQYMQGIGYNLPSRKYIMMIENLNTFCGLTSTSGDENPDPALNRANNETNIAVVGRECWRITAGNRSTALHELMHMLGAVNRGAPHANAGGHVDDGYDLLTTNNSPTLCFDEASRGLLDCGNDDYFNTNPPAGSYLALNWNTANSGWLNIGTVDTTPTPSPLPKPCKGRKCR